MADKSQQDVEESFRSSLEDVVAVAESLLPTCGSVEELVGVVKLALTNPGQLRILMGLTTAPKVQQRR